MMLSLIREKLDLNYLKLFNTLKERNSLISSIAPFKKGMGYDRIREDDLFSKLSLEFIDLSLCELLSISLIMEGQASKYYKYPRWSEGVHLKKENKGIEYLINPMILYHFDRERYLKIVNNLKDEYIIKDKVIAIDGPSGAGKSTVAKLVAKELNLVYVDTGAIFRGIALFCSNLKMEPTKEWLDTLDFSYGKDDKLIIINGKNLTDQIREHRVSELASKVSLKKDVRDFVLKIEKDLAKKEIVVMEGRDIGTAVFPDAFCKFFLTASSKIRAYRRQKEIGGDLIDIEKAINLRDERDSSRELSPLKKGLDAIEIDTNDLTIEDVKNKIVEYLLKNKYFVCKKN